MDRERTRLYNRQYNQLFVEKISRHQWAFLQKLARTALRQMNVDTQGFIMCQRLQAKGLVKTSTIGFGRGGTVRLTEAGAALVTREAGS